VIEFCRFRCSCTFKTKAPCTDICSGQIVGGTVFPFRFRQRNAILLAYTTAVGGCAGMCYNIFVKFNPWSVFRIYWLIQKIVINQSLKFLPQLKRVTTLPCEISVFKIEVKVPKPQKKFKVHLRVDKILCVNIFIYHQIMIDSKFTENSCIFQKSVQHQHCENGLSSFNDSCLKYNTSNRKKCVILNA